MKGKYPNWWMFYKRISLFVTFVWSAIIFWRSEVSFSVSLVMFTLAMIFPWFFLNTFNCFCWTNNQWRCEQMQILYSSGSQSWSKKFENHCFTALRTFANYYYWITKIFLSCSSLSLFTPLALNTSSCASISASCISLRSSAWFMSFCLIRSATTKEPFRGTIRSFKMRLSTVRETNTLETMKELGCYLRILKQSPNLGLSILAPGGRMSCRV